MNTNANPAEGALRVARIGHEHAIASLQREIGGHLTWIESAVREMRGGSRSRSNAETLARTAAELAGALAALQARQDALAHLLNVAEALVATVAS